MISASATLISLSARTSFAAAFCCPAFATPTRIARPVYDALRAVSRTFILLFLLWLIVEVVLGVLVTSYVPRIKSWIPLANLVLTPVVAVCSVMLARWIVVFRYPERTAVADAKAAARLGSGRIS